LKETDRFLKEPGFMKEARYFNPKRARPGATYGMIPETC